MFSNRIAGSAKFLQMPVESQLLYFHLVMRADDDGIVETYPIMKLLGTAPDSYRVLLARGYIRQLNDDQVVVLPDWLEHNVIRADRKVDSIYRHLLPKDIDVIEAKPRSDVEDNSRRIGGPSTDGISQGRLGKGKVNKPTARAEDSSEENKAVSELIDAFSKFRPDYRSLFKRPNEREAAKCLIRDPKIGLARVKTALKVLYQNREDRFAPLVDSPLELSRKWVKVYRYVKPKVSNQND